jgi:hypothetical protein
MPTPHKHAEAIKAWADGATIQSRRPSEDTWVTVSNPAWHIDYEYREKPPEFEHKWKKEIEAYTLRGKVVQWLRNGKWVDFVDGSLGHKPEPRKYAAGFDNPNNQFRIKPEVQEYRFEVFPGGPEAKHLNFCFSTIANLKLTFEDGVLTSAEVLK